MCKNYKHTIMLFCIKKHAYLQDRYNLWSEIYQFVFDEVKVVPQNAI